MVNCKLYEIFSICFGNLVVHFSKFSKIEFPELLWIESKYSQIWDSSSNNFLFSPERIQFNLTIFFHILPKINHKMSCRQKSDKKNLVNLTILVYFCLAFHGKHTVFGKKIMKDKKEKRWKIKKEKLSSKDTKKIKRIKKTKKIFRRTSVHKI